MQLIKVGVEVRVDVRVIVEVGKGELVPVGGGSVKAGEGFELVSKVQAERITPTVIPARVIILAGFMPARISRAPGWISEYHFGS
jgi:hypothetical protein